MSKDIYGLVGKSIHNSLSPNIHNMLFAEHDIDAEYSLFEVNELTLVVKKLKNEQIKGVNITKPYKMRIMDPLDKLDENVEKIGSSNTISQEDGEIKGYNTDGMGAKRSLERFTEIENKQVLQLGAGGAGRAIAYELSKSSEVTVLNRTLKKTKCLERFGVEAERLEKKTLKRELERNDILINTTSVGMNEKRSLIDPSLLDEDISVFDIVYSPLNTKLLKDAKETGCQTIDGLWMLIHQAVLAFQIWTDIKPDPDHVRKILMEDIR